ncbi:hypothetical protein CDD82_6954 [Ophiocordyceps australis]|uniref:F-box domain-containing protein n=1 Tax=Ophiocordyceps australis TaxID=1399860 RepID=A0A2C5YMJ9_9HYPO|nr:hypothetical protein CDD82_6954 [Ophiocordyceps australis]
MESMKLHMLPMEILIMIHQHLTLKELKAFSLCHHLLRAISERRIFEKIIVSWDPAEEQSSAILLLDRILERPELATYVHRLRLKGGNSLAPIHYEVPNGTLVKAIEAIMATRMPDSEFWVQKLQVGSMDAVATLLLALLPNLTRVYFQNPFCLSNKVLPKMLTHALSESAHDYQLPDFRKLIQVAFGCQVGTDAIRDDEGTTNRVKNLLPLFGLPSLERLYISIPGNTWAWPGVPPTYSSLTSFHVVQSQPRVIETLLATMPSLKTFFWEWVHKHRWTRGPNLNDAGRALASVSDQLTDLGISLQYDYSDIPAEFGVAVHNIGSLNTLRTMNNLTTLSLPWIFLMGNTNEYGPQFQSRIWSKLPERLEILNMSPDVETFMLSFSWTSSEAIRIMMQELEARRDRSLMQQLAKIKIPVPFEETSWTELIEECEEWNVPYITRSYAELSDTFGLQVLGREPCDASPNDFVYYVESGIF